MNFYSFVKNLILFFLKILYRIKIIGEENIPKNSNAIICSNHSSLLDPLIVGVNLKRQIYFMAKKELFKNKLLKHILLKLGAFPVNRQNADLTAIKKSLRILKKGNLLGLFPEGTRVKEKDTHNVKPGIAMISIKSRSPIIPVLIKTDYKLFHKITVYIGEPIEFEEYYGQKLTVDKYKELSKYVLEKIYSLDNKSINKGVK